MSINFILSRSLKCVEFVFNDKSTLLDCFRAIKNPPPIKSLNNAIFTRSKAPRTTVCSYYETLHYQLLFNCVIHIYIFIYENIYILTASPLASSGFAYSSLIGSKVQYYYSIADSYSTIV